MNAFGWFGWVVLVVINTVVAGCVTAVVVQILAIRKGTLDKDDGSVIGLAKLFYERYLEDEDDDSQPPEDS